MQFTDATHLSFSEKIVLELTEELLDQGYHLHVDNYYGSFRRGQYLFTRDTLLTCTVRQRRGPSEILQSLHVPVKSNSFARHDNRCVKMVDQKSSGRKTVYSRDHKFEYTIRKEGNNRILVAHMLFVQYRIIYQSKEYFQEI